MHNLALAPQPDKPIATLTAHDAVRITDRALRSRTWNRALAVTSNGDQIAIVADADTHTYEPDICVSTIDARVMALQSLADAATDEIKRIDPFGAARRRVDIRLTMLLAAVEFRD
jgi:hypothetical protein